MLCGWCRILATVCLNTQSKELPLWQAEIQTFWDFLSPLGGYREPKAHTGGGPNSFALHTAQISSLTLWASMRFMMRLRSPYTGWSSSQLRLHLVQPVDHGQQSVHRLAWKQQDLHQLVLPEKSIQTLPIQGISFLWIAQLKGNIDWTLYREGPPYWRLEWLEMQLKVIKTMGIPWRSSG